MTFSDTELIYFATAFRTDILNGHSSFCMCFALCAPRVSPLELSGFACRLAQSDPSDGPYAVANNCWIEVNDGRALDPTADQFLDDVVNDDTQLLPPVHLGPPFAFRVGISVVAS